MRKVLALAALYVTVPLASARGQVVIETPNGPIELIGLKRWTYRDLEDSLARVAPGQTLRSHACEAILQEKLFFPGASVRSYVTYDGEQRRAPPTFVITLVEPQDSARVRWRSISGPSRGLPKSWRTLRATLADSVGGLRFGDLVNLLQFYGTVRRDGPEAARARVARFDPAAVDRGAALWRALSARATAHDLELALAVLERDANAEQRMLAAAVLANFRSEARAWRGLAAALRDPDHRVQGAASSALAALAHQGPVRVDWRPAVLDLRALLAGTNVSAFTQVLDVLAKTQVDTSLAGPLLRDNSDLLVAHARARHDGARTPAWTLLGVLSGRPNAGPDVWEKWLQTLEWRGSGEARSGALH